ncbi:MAG TPA: hypothetical protein DCG54_04745 [Anaerolineae bacterium]|jgi:nitrate/TMAO reductase-like tetraheme cytochrome c subunit/mono/diheme cytochrome c family protein|nr:hypothetical protein [Anaerolineae bacterium]
MQRFNERIRNFFIPSPGSPRWMWVPPILVILFLGAALLGGGIHGWEYSNSPEFCGTACHTMPPQSVTYLNSPHANVTCEECHIGRASFPDQMMRKTQGLKEAYYMIFKLYEYPIRASALQPARNTCEKCHKPESFAGDTFRTITHFENDVENTPYDTYLILKTGGGAKHENLGKGIHWHIVNTVEYYEADPLGQTIPYVRVHNDDGTTTEYIDTESGFDPNTLDENQIRTMDCISCHNRVSHNFKDPAASMDDYLAREVIDPSIPDIHAKGIEVLSKPYETQEMGLSAIAGLENYYKTYYADFYNANTELVNNAIAQIQTIYKETVFIEQKINWETHPNNLGHMKTAGCFRCHDGKHLSIEQEAIRLECNLCHSIPVVAGQQDFVSTIEISRGPEPESHRNSNWISLHNQSMDKTCENCHTIEDAGGVSNTSFCSNSACHGNVFTYAGFDAPKLREILQAQLAIQPTEEPQSLASEAPSYESNVKALFETRCAVCHGEVASGGLSVTTFEALIKGSDKGPVIIPDNIEESLLIQVQSEQHFANFNTDELDFIKQWIEAGAPEK